MREQIVTLKNGMAMPTFGMGTWYLGEQKRTEQQEIEALRAGIDAGIRLIDTAEMYGNGLSEKLIGKAIAGYDRQKLFLVSKVYPHNAGRAHIFDSLTQTLENLQTDYLDLYLLHWRGRVPFSETVACMEELVAAGKIKSWGVSNLDTDDMEELFAVPNGSNCVVNQVLYHLGSRGVEYELLPWLRAHQVAMMAYCPLAQAGDLKSQLLRHPAVQQIAAAHGVGVLQVLLAFVMYQKDIIAIPRSGKAAHVLENIKGAEVVLTDTEYRILDQAFPAPAQKTYLDIV